MKFLGKFLGWRGKSWQQRSLLVLTIVALFLFAAHPELRLFVPLIDLIGLDLFFLLMASQLLDSFRPALAMVRRHAFEPAVHLGCDTVNFLLPIAGPYVETQVRVPWIGRP